jgi:hypothetical protein
MRTAGCLHALFAAGQPKLHENATALLALLSQNPAVEPLFSSIAPLILL